MRSSSPSRAACQQALPPLRSALHTDDFAAMAQMMKDNGAEESCDPKAHQLLQLLNSRTSRPAVLAVIAALMVAASSPLAGGVFPVGLTAARTASCGSECRLCSAVPHFSSSHRRVVRRQNSARRIGRRRRNRRASGVAGLK